MLKKLFSRIKSVFKSLCSLFQSRADLALENLALRQQVAVLKKENPRPKISLFDKAFWIGLRKIWSKWINALIIVKPETVVRWHRQGFKFYWNFISRRGKRKGRPPVTKEIRDMIRKIANENPIWRAPKVHAEMVKLGYDVSERSVSRYMPKRKPDEDKIKRWKAFLKNQMAGIAAMDFFTVPTVFFKQLYGFFIIKHERRKVIHVASTYNPNQEWVIQQLRNAFPEDTAPKYLIFDRDNVFNEAVKEAIKSFGIKPKQISYKSPWQNGVAER